MESADPAQLQLKLGQQDAILESQQQQLLAVMQCVQTIAHQMASLSTTVQAAHPSPDPWTAPASAPTDLGSGYPLALPTTTREVRWIPRGLQELPDPMPAHLQPTTQLLSH